MPQPWDNVCGQNFTLRGFLLAKDGAPEFWDKIQDEDSRVQYAALLAFAGLPPLETRGDTSTARIILYCIRALCISPLERKYDFCK